MAMIRPRGEALKIAEKVVPGLRKAMTQDDGGMLSKDPRRPQRDEVENKVIDINEAKGGFLDAKKSYGRR